MFGVSSIQGLSEMKDEKLKKFINYNGFYRGFVVSTDDPKHLGRVKVRIPAIHGANPDLDSYMADNTLPWASPGIFPLAGPGMGQLILPYIGSTVWVTFEVDQPQNAIYFGNLYSTKPEGEKYIQGPRFIYQGTQLKCEKDDLEAYKASVYTLLKTLKGASITIDDSDMIESIEFKDALGQFIRMSNEGELISYGVEPGKDKCMIEIGSGKSSIIIRDKGIETKGRLPYQTHYFIDVSNVPDELVFEVDSSLIFSDNDLTTKPDSITNGAKIVYINSDRDIIGFGVITNISDDKLTISNDLVRNPYPVGSCYFAMNGVDPDKEFGGHWEKRGASEPICWVRVS